MKETLVVHDGNFHTDDVFAIAFLLLFRGKDNFDVRRSRDEELILSADWVIDVGGEYDHSTKRYDHHQNGAPVRDSGIPYSAFGLLWKHYGEEWCGSGDVAKRIDDKLVIPIDANDNGVILSSSNFQDLSPFTIDDVVDSFLPVWGSDEDVDKAFFTAVEFAKNLLLHLKDQTIGKEKQLEVAHSLYEQADDKRILVSEVSLSPSIFSDYQDVLCIVQPDQHDPEKWYATAVRAEKDSFKIKVSFPAEWAGLRDKELAETSAIHDAVFCHKNRFLFAAKSREGALKAAEVAVERHEPYEP